MSSKARLQKQPDVQFDWETWVIAHATPILIIIVISLVLLVVFIIATLFNVAAAPTGTEANVYYNGFKGVI